MQLYSETISSLSLIGTAFITVFVVISWGSLVFWTYRDIRKRARGFTPLLLACLVSAIFFIPGVLIYLILRPGQTLEEEYQKALDEEALLQTIEDVPTCPKCGKRVKEDWLACPYCHDVIKRSCQKCARILDPAWDICPFCASPVKGAQRSIAGSDSPYTPLSGNRF
jgi:RNA polymerase subunit RPABC4/transcription elongation factor Spt4